MEYLSHRVDPNEIKAGDHIYTWMTAYSYAHHGIYVGKNMVVHFTAPENYKSGFGWNLPSSYAYLSASCLNSLGPEFSHPKSGENDSSSLNLSSCSHCISSDQNLRASCLNSLGPEFSHPKSGENDSSGLNLSSCSHCLSSDQNLQALCMRFPDCGFKLADSGVVISCLNCFIGTGSLYLYRYGVKTVEYISKVRGGTCTTAQSDPPQEVIYRAMYLLQNNIFGDYHLVRNNCEDFALYCKTGLLIGGRPTTGSSGQVNFVSNAPWKSIITSTLQKLVGDSSNAPWKSIITSTLPKLVGDSSNAPWKSIITSTLPKLVGDSSNAPWKSIITSTLPKLVSNSSMGVVKVVADTCYNRYQADIGVRDDVVKVKVEDMPLFRNIMCWT